MSCLRALTSCRVSLSHAARHSAGRGAPAHPTQRPWRRKIRQRFALRCRAGRGGGSGLPVGGTGCACGCGTRSTNYVDRITNDDGTIAKFSRLSVLGSVRSSSGGHSAVCVGRGRGSGGRSQPRDAGWGRLPSPVASVCACCGSCVAVRVVRCVSCLSYFMSGLNQGSAITRHPGSHPTLRADKII